MNTAGVTAATPDPSIQHLQADEWRIKQMSDKEKLISTCMFCKTLYRNPGVANKCEHWHYPIPTLKL
ncbi:hypothetical protein ACFORO_10480 [Amycolatopsis halotolerans]|uniref:Uncharacterized protein n=1 Tax=Amycolatopsis halotolerans TaxID=330083 RepID=A0ABV7QB86_9PSEU